MAASVARAITQWQRTEILELLKKARKVYKSTSLEMRVAPAKKPYGRILIIIPRAVGNAPQRNLLRRRVKAIFYQEQLYTRGYNVLLFAKKGASSLSFNDLKAIVTTLARLPTLRSNSLT